MYKRKSPVFGIPYMASGDTLSENEERRRAIVIENLLQAAMHGVRDCVFEDGQYVAAKRDNGWYSVEVLNTGELPAFEGMIKGRYCYEGSRLIWTKIREGNESYLYVNANADVNENPSSLIAVVKENGPYPKPIGLLVAKVTFENGKPVIDTHPDGKVYSKDIALHATDKTNPHGTEMIQDKLVVREKISYPGQLKTTVLQAQSWGKKGLVIERENEIVMCQMQEMTKDAETLCLGQVGYDYETLKKVTIYNDGDEGVLVRVVVWEKL